MGTIHQAYVQQYGEIRAAVLMVLQMHNPYRSWWYTGLLGLLTLSLLICVIDRAPTIYRQSFRPRFMRDPDSYKSVNGSTVISGKAGLSDSVKRVLKKGGYRVWETEQDGKKFFDGEKFQIARSGNFMIHVGFILLVIGGAMISRGELRTRAGGFPGELLSEDESQWGFNVRVDDFVIEYYPLAVNQWVEVDGRTIGRIIAEHEDGTFDIQTHRPTMGDITSIEPDRIKNHFDMKTQSGRLDQPNISDYVATLTIIENGQDVSTHRVEVNYPMRHNGYRFYQSSFNDERKDGDGKWTTILEVRKDSGSPFIWSAIVLVSFGLILGMWFVPRQIFVAIVTDGDVETIHMAGIPKRNRTLFIEEFDKIVDKIKKTQSSST